MGQITTGVGIETNRTAEAYWYTRVPTTSTWSIFGWVQPKTVFAYGDLNFYGQAAAEKRGVTQFYYRCHGSEAAKNDPFAIDLESNPTLKGLYLDAEEESGYIRDRSVFSDDISIEDTMAALVRYKSGAMLSYSLNTYLPWEGFNVAINGSKGRIEYTALEKPYINAGGKTVRRRGYGLS